MPTLPHRLTSPPSLLTPRPPASHTVNYISRRSIINLLQIIHPDHSWSVSYWEYFIILPNVTDMEMRQHYRLSYYRPQRSCGKVIFSQACVKNSVHRGLCTPPGQTPSPRQTPPPGRRLLQWTIRILLECILVSLSLCSLDLRWFVHRGFN